MHDGQMLYDSTNNWNHKEWGVDETAGRLIAEGKTRPFIVVGIWNNGKFRHSEYFPQQVIDYIPDDQKKDLMHLLEGGPMADHYLQFIVTELKPFIDSAFSTRKDRDNTLIGGSSMGGLISMYAFCEYPNVFGSAACLSTHWTGIFRLDNNPIPDAMIQYLKARLPKPKQGRKIYFDYGTATLDALYKGTQIRADAVLEAKGYRAKNWITREFPGADHSENAWGARLSIPLLFLLGK
jgi:predicted alpha/beta superfamily hydrolase